MYKKWELIEQNDDRTFCKYPAQNSVIFLRCNERSFYNVCTSCLPIIGDMNIEDADLAWYVTHE